MNPTPPLLSQFAEQGTKIYRNLLQYLDKEPKAFPISSNNGYSRAEIDAMDGLFKAFGISGGNSQVSNINYKTYSALRAIGRILTILPRAIKSHPETWQKVSSEASTKDLLYEKLNDYKFREDLFKDARISVKQGKKRKDNKGFEKIGTINLEGLTIEIHSNNGPPQNSFIKFQFNESFLNKESESTQIQEVVEPMEPYSYHTETFSKLTSLFLQLCAMVVDTLEPNDTKELELYGPEKDLIKIKDTSS